MHDIISGAGVVSKLMDEIAVTTLQQEKGISQITIALAELEKVTQSNVIVVGERSGFVRCFTTSGRRPAATYWQIPTGSGESAG